MMSSAKDEHCRFERPIEIYENERMWIGRGFSKMGLLPTERGPYSTKDGSLSWKTMHAASIALLRGNVMGYSKNGKGSENSNGKSKSVSKRMMRRGWSFHEEDGNNETNDSDNLRKEDEYECTESGFTEGDYCGFSPMSGAEDGPSDEDGWQYFQDFSTQMLTSPNGKRGMLDFVRRRKLRRLAIFRPDHFLPREVHTKCDYCDSSVVNMLSSAMLDALSLATLFAYGLKDNVSDAQALPLKSKLIDTLSIGENCDNETQSEEYDPWVGIHRVKDRLCTFAETCVGKPGPLMHLLNPDVEQNLVAAMPGRRKIIARYLNEQERLNLARLLIKDIDRYSNKMHCGSDSCACVSNATHGNSDHDDDQEDACEFRLVSCPNERCNAIFSFKHRTQHDGECEYKRIHCPNGCGTEVPRKEVHEHVRDKCSLRSAECPLAIVGCTCIVQAQDIPCHLRDHADNHFILVANRMMEYQNVFKDMNARIRLLEENNARLEREMKRTTAQLQSKNEAKAVSTDVKKLTKRLGTLESTCRTEFKKVEFDRRKHSK